MSETQAQIDEHNRRESWRDVTANLAMAQLAVERAQGALDDLHLSAWGESLQPIVDSLRRAGTEAAEAAEDA